MLVVAFTATTRRLPARAAPRAIATSPSGWIARWRPTGPITIGADTVVLTGVDRATVDESDFIF
jgi:hypothetical protein